MRKHNILFFSALLFLTACTGNNVPDGIIEKDKMIDLMVDVHIVDGSLYNIDAPTADSLYKHGIDRYTKLFKRHHTDSTQFKKSVNYYTLHPEELEKMYEKITQKLQAKTDSINKVPTKTRPKR